jgi:hypothetical protein
VIESHATHIKLLVDSCSLIHRTALINTISLRLSKNPLKSCHQVVTCSVLSVSCLQPPVALGCLFH